jgi:hypothetical protein
MQNVRRHGYGPLKIGAAVRSLAIGDKGSIWVMTGDRSDTWSIFINGNTVKMDDVDNL